MRCKKEDSRSTCEFIDIPAYSSTCHLTLHVPGPIHSYCRGEQCSKTEKQSSKTQKPSSKVHNFLKQEMFLIRECTSTCVLFKTFYSDFIKYQIENKPDQKVHQHQR